MGEREICRFVLSQMGGWGSYTYYVHTALGGKGASKKQLKIGRLGELYCKSAPNLDKGG